MDCMLNGIFGLVLNATVNEIMANVNQVVAIICSALIALVTCFVQLYRLWRDRDADKHVKKIEKEKEKEDLENDAESEDNGDKLPS